MDSVTPKDTTVSTDLDNYDTDKSIEQENTSPVKSEETTVEYTTNSSSISTSANSTPVRTWGSWWESTQNQAKELATKASVIAVEATKVAQEKATEIANKAAELRQNYDLDVATSILSTLSPALKPNQPPSKAPLDLVYITENIVAMAFPTDTSKHNSTPGNDIRAVSLFFRRRHAGHFMVWNVSEESYDYSLFADQVLEYKFPGHPAPPLGLLFKICTSVESWLDADERNVAVAHCLTGKGRTSALLACVLTWIGEFPTPFEALQYIADRRETAVDHLTIPSQRRYLQYFSNMLDGVKPRPEPLLLRRIIMSSIPVFGTNGSGSDNAGCCPYIQLFKCGKLIATAIPLSNDSSTENNQGLGASRLQLKWYLTIEGSVSFSIDTAVQGDILLRCRHADVNGNRTSMFRAAFHTGYVPCGVLRLTKAQLDGASSDDRFEDDFFIDLIFAPIEKSDASSNSTTSSTPTDSGLVIDSLSTDRYEMSLHRDSRFWESVAARKLRSKKRRSRKFISSTQEKFSIGDDYQTSAFEDELNEIKFSTKTSNNPIPSGNSISNLSDEELIMQLAQVQESETTPIRPISSATSISSTKVTPSQATSELLALEDLEKELGLDDLNLFKTSTASGVTVVETTEVTSTKVDEDNLDELEKYLESLNS